MATGMVRRLQGTLLAASLAVLPLSAQNYNATDQACCSIPLSPYCDDVPELYTEESWVPSSFEMSLRVIFGTICKQNILLVATEVDVSTDIDICIHPYDFGWDLGYQLGFEWMSVCDDWGIGADFWYMEVDAEGRTDGAAYGNAILPGTGLITTTGNTISANTEADYWLIDLHWWTRCRACDNLLLQPLLGVRCGKIEFDTDRSTDGVLVTGGSGLYTAPTITLSRMNMHSEYKLCGIRGGLGLEYCWRPPISIKGRFAGTAALADVTREVSINLIGTDITISSDSDCHGIVGFDAEGGFLYRWCECGWNLGVELDYFAHAWSSVSEPLDTQVSFAEKGAIIHGFRFGVTVDF